MTALTFTDRAAQFNFNRAVHLDIMYTRYLAASAANARRDINGGLSIVDNVTLAINDAVYLNECDNPNAVY